MSQHFYGYIKSKPDPRDANFSFKTLGLAPTLPISVDLRKSCSPIRDQGQLGSCTAESMTGAYEFYSKAITKHYTTLSVLFEYYNTRLYEGTVDEDSGCELRDSLKILQKQGVCANTYWRYDINRFAEKPSKMAYKRAGYKITSYHTLSDLMDVKTALASGNVVVIGFTVYDSFESDAVANTGIMPVPKPYESILGGHAVVVVGYNDTKQWLIVRNSWGRSWGDKGYFYMPYSFLTSTDTSGNPNVSDLWVMQIK